MDGKGIGVGHQCRGERHLFNSNEMYKKRSNWNSISRVIRALAEPDKFNIYGYKSNNKVG